MRRLFKNIDRAMAARTRPNSCGLYRGVGPDGGCNGPKPTPPPTVILSQQNFQESTTLAYAGAKIGATKSLPPIDKYGAQMNGYATSTTQYVLNASGQNAAPMNKSTLSSFGAGTFQHGTTTFTVHPTLPLVRYGDPVLGSGAIYYDSPSQTIKVASTTFHANSYVAVPSNPISRDTAINMEVLGMAVFCTALAFAGILFLGATIVEASVVAAAFTVACAVLALAAVVFGLITWLWGLNSNPFIPGTAPYDVSLGDGPPDGLGVTGDEDGSYPDGGGPAGSDQPLFQ
jgi:hypothetical protein